MSKCAYCNIRTSKRDCPALHSRICPQCCGEHRMVKIQCPDDCPYLAKKMLTEERKYQAVERKATPQEQLWLKQFLTDQDFYYPLVEQLLTGLVPILLKDSYYHDADILAAINELLLTVDVTQLNPAEMQMNRKSVIQFSFAETVKRYCAVTRKVSSGDVRVALTGLKRSLQFRQAELPYDRSFIDQVLEIHEKLTNAKTTEAAQDDPSASFIIHP